jgi:hypothetical protein
MLRNALLLAVVATLVSCAAESEPRLASAKDITVAQVLASPRRFDGKRLSVVGYYFVAYEDSYLFTTRGAAKRKETERCISVDFPDGSDLTCIAGRYARIVGTFHDTRDADSRKKATNQERVLLWPFVLQDVTSFHPMR